MIVSSPFAILWTLTTRRRRELPSPFLCQADMKNTLQQTGHSKGAVAVLSLPSYLKNSRPTRTSRPSFPSTPRGQNYNESLTVCVNRPAKKRKERKEFNHCTQVYPTCRSWKKSRTGNKKKVSHTTLFLLSILPFLLQQTIKKTSSSVPLIVVCCLLPHCHMAGAYVGGEGGVSQSARFHRFVSLSPFFPFFLSLVLLSPA